MRKRKIKELWPLMAPPHPQVNDIRKFEEIGTHPTAPRLAIAEALTFYEGIGPERKEARLRYLRDRWAKRLVDQKGVKLFTSFDPDQSCGIGTVGIEDVDPGELSSFLFKQHRILVTPIAHKDFSGIRVTPNTYTALREIDIFCEAMEDVIRNPGAPGPT